MSRLLDISQRELENQKLSQSDYDFIKNFAENINSIVAGASGSTQKTSLIADVHTDQNTKSVLEEGTGYIRLMMVAYKMPEGHILVGFGPVYSYYEFKQPMSDRLTDEKWRDMLGSGKAPALAGMDQIFCKLLNRKRPAEIQLVVINHSKAILITRDGFSVCFCKND